MAGAAMLIGPSTRAADGFRVPGGREVARATFSEGRPVLDFSVGERRLGRIWASGGNPDRSPEDGSYGRVSLGNCLERDENGRYFWNFRTEAAFDAVGVVQPLSGSFSGWFRQSAVMKSGVPWLTGRYSLAGGPFRAGVTWALGVGGYRDQPVPLHRPSPFRAGRLYLSTPWGTAAADRPIPETPWVHVAAVWDAEAGMRLYLNGEKVADTFAKTARPSPAASRGPDAGGSVPPVVEGYPPVPLDRLQLNAHPGGGVRDLAFFDYPLNDAGVRLAYEGRLDAIKAVFHEEPVALERTRRLRWLGWSGEAASDAIPKLSPEGVLVATEAVVTSARENRRAAGWLAVDHRNASLFPWWYHGYGESGPKTLLLSFEEALRPDYLVTQGDLSGRVKFLSNGKPVEELELPLPGGNAVIRRRLRADAPLANGLFLTKEEGALSEIRVFQLDPSRDAIPKEPARVFYLPASSDAEVPLKRGKKAEWLGSYPRRDRAFTVLTPQKPGQPAPLTLPALRPVHWFIPAQEDDFPLQAVRIRFSAKLDGPTRFHLHLHDGFDRWRDWSRLDFLAEPDAQGRAEVDVTLRLRETLVRKGDPVWIAVTPEKETTLEAGGATVSLIRAASPARAERLWKEWHLATMRDAIEAISEPRPWSKMDADPETTWWLRIAYPEYEEIDRIGTELRKRFPGDPVVESWFAFTHPQMPNPAANLPLPEAGEHPRWAVLAKENLRLYGEFVRYWTEQRATESGELGNWVGDDSDLLMDWLDLHFIADPGNRAGDLLVKFADGIWNRFHSRGNTRSIENGLNARHTDDLHAYEDGVNIQSAAFWARYGDPLIYHRLLKTASRYDGFLFSRTATGALDLAARGKGRVYWSSTERPTGNPRHHPAYWNLIFHPGLTALWYGAHPKLEEIFRAVGKSRLETTPAGEIAEQAWPAAPLFHGLFYHFGAGEWLDYLVDRSALAQGRFQPRHRSIDPALLDRLETRPLKMAAPAGKADGEPRFARLMTESLGDRRFDLNWLEWKSTGDLRTLEAGLEALHRKLEFMMPAVTLAEQSGDRVAIPKSLISLIYLGGVASARNASFYPNIAVSYEGFSPDYAALVLENRPERLTIAFYNFREEPMKGVLRPWRLLPGLYRQRAGQVESVTLPPAGEEELPETGTASLERGCRVPVELPARALWIWQAELKQPGAPLLPRADLALSPEAITRVGSRRFRVEVFNIGTLAAPPSRLRVCDQEGTVLAEQPVPALEWPVDFQPRSALVEIELPPGTSRDLSPFVFEVTPKAACEEITRLNNTVRLPSPGGDRRP